MRSRTRLIGAAVGALLLALLAPQPQALAHPANAIIDNGTVQLGVWDEGHLNVPGGNPSSGTGTTRVGLRYLPTGAEATAPGCLCEGWGVADATSGVAGYANESVDGVVNLTPVSFVFDATSAVSTVEVGTTFRVTHDYHPSPDTANLYEVDVTVENISADPVDLRYRRVMDWDIEPTAFNEFATIQGTAGAADVLFTSNDGFASANPLSGPSDLGQTGDFVDAGPQDHGALFDFGFGNLDPGETKSFRTFYGAAGNEADALGALAAVSAEIYSFGQPTSSDPSVGEPNTFIFAFAGVGGTPIGGGTVDIDIKPGSDPNSVKLSNRGVIPVAILTTDTFDATTVDPASVCFGDAEEPSERDCTEVHGTGHVEDVDGDGDLDLVLHYETRETGIDPGDTEACLTGTTTGGQAINGCDAIRTL
jgi:hypothetical protein